MCMIKPILNIVIGTDHRGFAMKEWLKKNLHVSATEISWLDVGTFDDQRTDYPLYATLAAQAIQEKKADVGILLCGTGVGMAIVANRFAGIYAALVWNKEIARASKEDDNANILVLPSDFVSNEQALEMIQAWLHASFKKGRYQYRIDMIDAI